MGWVGGGMEHSNQMLLVVGAAIKIEVIKIEVIKIEVIKFNVIKFNVIKVKLLLKVWCQH